MGDEILGLGLCCSLAPTTIIGLLAWSARARANEAMKEASATRLEMNKLERQIDQLRLRQAPPSPAAIPVAPPPVVDEFIPAPLPVAAPTPPPPPTPPTVRPAPPPAPVPPAAPIIEWEKWLGVRGAAVLGGIVFAMAGVYLFRYSIAQGWISPAMRVVAAMLAGLGGLIASQRLRERYTVTAQAFGAGGIVVLYAATWASRALYELVPTALAFVLMVLITAVAGVLAVRQSNRLAAYLGLLGGFATPLLLSTGQNSPIALFTYVFVLDLAVLAVAYLRRWRSVAALALGATLLLELAWILLKMEPHQLPIAFVVLTVFAVLFTLFVLRFEPNEAPSPLLRMLRGAALLTPVLALLYFTASSQLEVPLAPTVGFLAVLLVGVGFIHRKGVAAEGGLLAGAIGMSSLVLIVAAFTRPSAELTNPTLLIAVLALVAVSLLNTHWPQLDDRRELARTAAQCLTATGLFTLLIGALRLSHDDTRVWFVGGVVILSLVQVWLSRASTNAAAHIAFGLVPVVTLGIDFVAAATSALPHAYSSSSWAFGPSALLAVLLLLAMMKWPIERVVASFSIATLAGSLVFAHLVPAEPILVMVVSGVFAIIALLVGIRLKSPGIALTAVALFGLRLMERFRSAHDDVAPVFELFVLASLLLLVMHGLLLLAGTSFAKRPGGAVIQAATVPLFFLGLLIHFRDAFGVSMQGALPVGLAIISLASAALMRRNGTERGVMWQLAVGAAALAVAVPLQLENQWLTIGWALMAVAHLALWRRYDSRALKWSAATLLAIVSARLVLNPWVFEYHSRSGVPVFNWLTYTYLIPAACLIAATWMLGELETKRLRGWETSVFDGTRAWLASSSGISAALVIFAWVTLSVFDFFGTNSSLELNWDRLPARDLALSLCWIVYAVALLAIGMWRKSRAMRWMSLVFLLVSIGKVFLYDLGELRDLYRVASLTGLAISLLGISLAYQRFVFRRDVEASS